MTALETKLTALLANLIRVFEQRLAAEALREAD